MQAFCHCELQLALYTANASVLSLCSQTLTYLALLSIYFSRQLAKLAEEAKRREIVKNDLLKRQDTDNQALQLIMQLMEPGVTPERLIQAVNTSIFSHHSCLSCELRTVLYTHHLK